MAKKKREPAPATHEEDEDLREELVEEELQDEAPPSEEEAEQLEDLDPAAPPATDDAKEEELEKLIAEGAVKGVELPKVSAEAEDWGDKMGRALKLAMEASPNGVPIEVLRVERMGDGAYYELTFRTKRDIAKGRHAGQRVSGTIQTSEFVFLREKDTKRLGKWMRRFGNAALGRKLTD